MDWLEEQGDDTIAKAQLRYPVLGKTGVRYSKNYQSDKGFLEFWQKDEVGTKERPRPKDFPIGTIGVEILDPKTRPIDILGDVVSHHLVKTDPNLKEYYTQFKSSLTDKQKDMLQQQYVHAQQSEGEQRPYKDWRETSGLPAMFRGYAFEQWDKPEEIYTPEQLRMFDKMTSELKRR